MLYVIFLLFLSTISDSAFVKEISSEREARARLRDDLANHRVFDTKLTPLSQSQPVDAKFGFLVLQIADVSEATQTAKYRVFMNVTWRDEDLAWIPQHYGNISYISIPTNLLWHPTFFITNGADDVNNLGDPNHVTLRSDGWLEYKHVGVVTISCDFDLTYYPLDVQTCMLMLLPDGGDVPVIVKEPYLLKPEETTEFLGFIFNGEWVLQNNSLTVAEGFGFSRIQISITMKRTNLFYVLCILLPMIVTSFLTLLVFLIPAASGEKMSYLVSIYVSTSLFLNFVGDTLPRNMSLTNVPRMTQFLVFVIFECVLALAATVLVMRRYQREQANISEQELDVSDQANLNVTSQAPAKIHEGKQDSETISSGTERLSRSLSSTTEADSPKKGIRCFKFTMRGVSSANLDTLFFWSFLSVCVPFYALVFII